MEESKISVNIGGHTFEASGPDANEQFKVFVEMLKAGYGQNPNAKPDGPVKEDKLPKDSKNEKEGPIDREELLKVFELDENRQILHLRYPPEIESDDKKEKVKAGILMLLYGFKELLGTMEVGVTKLSTAIEDSALGTHPRLTFATDPLQNQNHILRSGRKSGTKYRNTPSGVREAKQLIERTFEKIG